MAGQLGPYIETGIAELIGINEVVAQNQFSKSITVSVAHGTGEAQSGEIDQIGIYMSEDGTGAIQAVDGNLLFLDADPAVSAGDAALAAAEWLTIFGQVAFVAADFVTDANGGFAFKTDISVRFHSLTNIYLAFLLTSATSINSLAGDDEQMEVNLWFRPVR